MARVGPTIHIAHLAKLEAQTPELGGAAEKGASLEAIAACTWLKSAACYPQPSRDAGIRSSANTLVSQR